LHAAGCDDGAEDERAVVFDGDVVEELAGFDGVGGVEEDEVGVGWDIEEGFDGGGGGVGDEGSEGDGRVDAVEACGGGLGLWKPSLGVIFVVEGLALEVGGFDDVAIDEGEGADAGAGEEVGGGCAQCAKPKDGDVGAGEELLALVAYGLEAALARVAVGCHG
jgi:hypothetical protein